MKEWEKRFLRYCVKQQLLSSNQARDILDLREKLVSQGEKKNLLAIVTQKMEWDSGEVKEHLAKACPDIYKKLYEKDTPLKKAPTNDARSPSQIIEQEGKDFVQLFDNQDETPEPDLKNKSTKIGKYVLIEKLGAGGMGIVYKAFHPDLNQHFAIKTIKSGQEIEDEHVRRFIREAMVAAKLKHPNIVAVHDVGEEKGQHYIVMDYIQGKDLKDIIHTEKLYPRFCLEIIKKVAEALDYAHGQGIIHRDIKPSNIIISEPDKQPYLMDFGLASIVQQESGITRSGQILGTPQYMSPEQAKGKAKRLDARSDIYSLGAALYEMLTGKPVVQNGTTMQILYQVVNKEPVPLSKHSKMIAQDVEAITMKCLEKEAGRRYQSARELADDIDRYLRGEPVCARPAGSFYRLTKWVKRNKALSGTIIVAMSIILVTNFWFMMSLKEKKDNLAQALNISEARRLEAISATKKAETAEDKKEKQLKAQRIVAEAVRWSEENRELHLIDEKLREAETEAPWYSELYREWGKAYYKCGEQKTEQREELFQKGLEKLNKAIELSPDDYLAWFYQYLIYNKLGEKEKSNNCIWEILRINPQNEYGFFGQGWKFYSDSKKTTEISAKKELQERSLNAYNIAIGYNKNFGLCYNNRGYLYYEIGSYDKAMKDYDMAIKLDPNDPTTYNNRALFYSSMKQYDEAIRDYDTAIKLDPKDPTTYNNRGFLYEETKKYEEAIKDYDKAISLNPKYTNAYSNRGILYRSMNRYEEAIKDYDKAISLNPNIAKVYNNRGFLYWSMDRYEEAMKDYDKAIALDPSLPIAYINRGKRYYQLKKYEEAMKDYDKAIALDPKDATAYNNRGLVYEETKKYKEAMKDYDKAISLNPDYIEACNNRGVLYRTMRKYDEAIRDYDTAINVSPNEWQLYLNRGVTYFRMKKFDKAISDLEVCKKLGGKSPLIDKYFKLCKEALEKQKQR